MNYSGINNRFLFLVYFKRIYIPPKKSTWYSREYGYNNNNYEQKQKIFGIKKK